MQEDNMERGGVTPASDDTKVLDPSQPIKVERTEAEKAAYNLKKNAERASELGLDPKKILGGDETNEVPAWYKAEKAKEAQKTAFQLADSITDEDTKEKVKDYLQNRLVPSGNPEEDFRLALGAASASKNKQILDEMNRYTTPRVVAAGASQPAKFEEEFVLTPEEIEMKRIAPTLSDEKIKAARIASQK